MNTTTYKGFTITQYTDSDNTQRFCVDSTADFFNQGGYATLGNARGAITKKINADYEVSLATPRPADAPSEALTGTLSARFDSLAVGDKFHDSVLPGHVLTKVCSENATSDETNCGTRLGYCACEQIFLHKKAPAVRPSRNKREGSFARRVLAQRGNI